MQQPGGTEEATGQPSVRGDKLSLYPCALLRSWTCSLAPPSPRALHSAISRVWGLWSALNLHDQGCPFDFCLPFCIYLSRACPEGTGSKEWTLHTSMTNEPTSQPTWRRETIVQYSPCLNPELNGGSKKKTYVPQNLWMCPYLGRGEHFADAIKLRISRWDHSGLEWALTAKTSNLIKEKGRGHKGEGHVARNRENGVTWP